VENGWFGVDGKMLGDARGVSGRAQAEVGSTRRCSARGRSQVWVHEHSVALSLETPVALLRAFQMSCVCQRPMPRIGGSCDLPGSGVVLTASLWTVSGT
jgi:hypothetical protein